MANVTGKVSKIDKMPGWGGDYAVLVDGKCYYSVHGDKIQISRGDVVEIDYSLEHSHPVDRFLDLALLTRTTCIPKKYNQIDSIKIVEFGDKGVNERDNSGGTFSVGVIEAGFGTVFASVPGLYNIFEGHRLTPFGEGFFYFASAPFFAMSAYCLADSFGILRSVGRAIKSARVRKKIGRDLGTILSAIST
jgi:hypothetical protein